MSVDSSTSSYRGRVYITYENKAADGSQDVFLAAFDRSLSPLLGAPTGHRLPILPRRHPVPYRSDQFWPASAIDQASGTLWVCFYDNGRSNAPADVVLLHPVNQRRQQLDAVSPVVSTVGCDG